MNLGVVLVKINIVPNKEHIDRPNAAAVVLLAGEVLVEPADKRVCIKEFLGGFAGEFPLYNAVILLVLQPLSGGYGEAELFLLGGFLGQVLCGSLAHCVLCVALVNAQARRQR